MQGDQHLPLQRNHLKKEKEKEKEKEKGDRREAHHLLVIVMRKIQQGLEEVVEIVGGLLAV